MFRSIDNNKIRIKENENYYKQRQAIVEHPYGTIKRQWGFNYIMTKKGKERANADVGFMFIAYNLRRIINIIGFEALMEYLKILLLYLLSKNNQIKGRIIYFKRLFIRRFFSVLQNYSFISLLKFN